MSITFEYVVSFLEKFVKFAEQEQDFKEDEKIMYSYDNHPHQEYFDTWHSNFQFLDVSLIIKFQKPFFEIYSFLKSIILKEYNCEHENELFNKIDKSNIIDEGGNYKTYSVTFKHSKLSTVIFVMLDHALFKYPRLIEVTTQYFKLDASETVNLELYMKDYSTFKINVYSSTTGVKIRINDCIYANACDDWNYNPIMAKTYCNDKLICTDTQLAKISKMLDSISWRETLKNANKFIQDIFKE
jgi:hypothetical protein